MPCSYNMLLLAEILLTLQLARTAIESTTFVVSPKVLI